MKNVNLRLEKILPEYVEDRDQTASEVWIRDLSFQHPSKYLVIAPSGTGKTTFAHILYGTDRRFTGDYHIGEYETRGLSRDQWAEVRQTIFSIVFQDLRLLGDLSAWENILLNGFLNQGFDESRVRHIGEELGLSHCLDSPVSSLSQGEKQRVSIVRALAQPYRWIILDEPFSHLDEENIGKAKEWITRVTEEQQAGLIALQLEVDNYWPYDKSYRM